MIGNILWNKREDIIVCIMLISFCAYKLQHIDLPYLSDELDVYAKGALYMYDHSPSIFPGDIPPELSRGHPLMFYFLSGAIFKIFGPSVRVAHLFILAITTLWLFLSYYFTKKLFGPQIALIAFLFLIAQPIINSQSTLLLPEVLLALFTICAIYFYLQGSLYYLLFSSFAILTKEVGIVLPLLVILLNFLPWFKKINPIKTTINRGYFFIPVIVFLSFFAVQKLQNGWFFFPLHTDYVSLNVASISFKLFKTFYFFSIAQGRFLLTLAFLGSFVYYLKNRKKKRDYSISKEERYILFLFLFIISIVAFTCINFYNNRYYLIMIPFLYVVFSYFIYSLVKGKAIKGAFVVIILISPLFFFHQNKKKYNLDVDMNYKYLIENQQDFFAFLEAQGLYATKIYANSPIFEGNEDPRFGYVKKRFNFSNEFDSTTEYVAISYLDIYSYYLPPKEEIEIVKRFRREFSTIDLYKVKKNTNK